MKKSLWIVSSVIGLCFSSLVSAGTGARNVVGVGCDHGNDGSATTCYITLDGAPFGPTSCSSNQARWNAASPGGKNAFAIFVAAYYGGKPVDLQISDTCYGGPGYGVWPTFLWFNN